jgi:hypothetical protein
MTYEFHLINSIDAPVTAIVSDIDYCPIRGDIFTIVDDSGTEIDYAVKFVRRKLWHPSNFGANKQAYLQDKITHIFLVKTSDIAEGKATSPLR